MSEWLLLSANVLLVLATGFLAFSTHMQAKAVRRQTTLAEGAEKRELRRDRPNLLVESGYTRTLDRQGSFLRFQGVRVVNTGTKSVVVNYVELVPAIPVDSSGYQPLAVERVVENRGTVLCYNDDLPTRLEPGDSLTRMYGQIELVERLGSTRVLPICMDSLRDVYRDRSHDPWLEFIGETDWRFHNGPGDGMKEQTDLPTMELAVSSPRKRRRSTSS